MKSFDEWFKDTMPNTHKGVGKEKTETFVYETAQDAWNFKQAEVDGLQLKLSEDSRAIHNVIDIEKKKCEELQKRINDALSEIESGITGKHHVKSIIKILKGNTNDH